MTLREFTEYRTIRATVRGAERATISVHVITTGLAVQNTIVGYYRRRQVEARSTIVSAHREPARRDMMVLRVRNDVMPFATAVAQRPPASC
jgi:hypothetical protein